MFSRSIRISMTHVIWEWLVISAVVTLVTWGILSHSTELCFSTTKDFSWTFVKPVSLPMLYLQWNSEEPRREKKTDRQHSRSRERDRHHKHSKSHEKHRPERSRSRSPKKSKDKERSRHRWWERDRNRVEANSISIPHPYTELENPLWKINVSSFHELTQLKWNWTALIPVTVAPTTPTPPMSERAALGTRPSHYMGGGKYNGMFTLITWK